MKNNKMKSKMSKVKSAVKASAPKVVKEVKTRARRKVKKLAQQVVSRGLATFLGSGDYVTSEAVNCNSLVNPTTAFTGPEVTNKGRRGVRVVESEFVGDLVSGPVMVAGGTAFNNQVFTLNPQNVNLFPWLSSMAPLFDQWEPNGIILRFKSTSSEYNGTSQALGTVMCAADYDSADAPYGSKVELENADYAVSCKASENFLMGVECDPTERPTKLLFTGPGAGSATSSNLHDLCRLQVATQGMSVAGVTLGELWIDYDVTFYKKQLTGLSILPQFPAATARHPSYAINPGDQWTEDWANFVITQHGLNIAMGIDANGSHFIFNYNSTGAERYMLTMFLDSSTDNDSIIDPTGFVVPVVSQCTFSTLDFNSPGRVRTSAANGRRYYSWSSTFILNAGASRKVYVGNNNEPTAPITLERRFVIQQINEAVDCSVT